MKCVCGYENISDCQLEKRIKKEPNFINGNQEFIHLESLATYRKYYSKENAEVYACPKCGTLRFER